jgi:hypothetical protein
VDRVIRQGRKRGIDGALYLHRSCRPLAEVDLRTLEDLGQLPLLLEECDGMCGV